jgi:hypothetical protein
MKRGAWLLGLGVSAAIAAFVTPGCSGSSSGGGGTPADGGKDTATSSGSGSGGDTGSGSGGGDTGSSSGASDSGGDASCPAAAQFFKGADLACVSANCCTPMTTCVGANDCLAIVTCVAGCGSTTPDAASDAGGGTCIPGCEADASATGQSDFTSLLTCILTNCQHGGGDAGGGG